MTFSSSTEATRSPTLTLLEGFKMPEPHVPSQNLTIEEPKNQPLPKPDKSLETKFALEIYNKHLNLFNDKQITIDQTTEPSRSTSVSDQETTPSITRCFSNASPGKLLVMISAGFRVE
ncbi:uncharacterized protein LOC130498641 [Raphanus sativus]|uniref:Uncharacterized protein LOC130498641 n=1 Tax=Raphanus sativus TaxID=3726 RepID=A0A9W3C9F4_RAPSA|nr:uncharacterized protein LOC130498641 [Raphanus sativus]